MIEWKWSKIVLITACSLLFFSACGKVSESYEKAVELSMDGNYEEAKTYFEDAIKEDGTEPKFYIGYGMALNHLLKYEAAKAAFSQILKSDAKMTDEEKKQIYYGRAIAFHGLGMYEDVTGDADRALKIKGFSDLDRNLRYIDAIAYFMLGKEKEAENHCKKIMEDDSSDMEAHMLYGGIKNACGDTEGAIKAYENAIKKDKSYYDAYFALYGCYQEMGQSSAAAELLETLTSIEVKKTSESIVVGKAWYYKGEYDKALSFFEKAYEEKEKKGLYYTALVKKTQGKLSEAEEGFLNYITLDKEDLIPDVYNQLAGIYMERSKYEKAQSMLSTGIALGDTEAMQDLLRNQVILLELEGDYDQALEYAKKYLQVYKEDASMKKELSFIKTRRK